MKRIRLSYVPCPGTPNPGRWKDKQVKSQSVIRPPIIGLPCRPRLPKVQNARNTAVIDLARSPSPTIANKTNPPSVSDPKAVKPGQNNSQAFRSLKLCSNANCTGIISVDSVATRCLDCVRRDWRSKRSKFSAKSSNIDNSGGAGRIASGILKAQESTKEKTKKKGVTWADEITSASSETEKLTEEGFPAMPNNSTADTDHKISVSEDNLVDNTVNLEDYLNLDDLIEQDSHIQDVSMQPLLDKDSSQVVQKASDSQAFAFDNASGRPAATEVPFIDGHGQLSKNISGPRAENSSQADALTSFAGQVTGWDSDLTELSDSGDGESHESSSSDSDSDNVHQPSTPSGLKIRIPARPGGIYAQKCASSSKCNQVLATSYRWKSCVMCRARSRDYQRKRQNIQGRHARLDQELLQSQNMGTPLAGDLQVTEKVEDPVTLVPGARLCSIRNCTYIIPPMEEYRWKMCALCRLRRRERSKQDKLSNLPLAATESLRPSEGKKRRLDADLILKALNNLPLQPQTRPGGRCQSVDCGMLIVDPKSAQCTQCIARRLWLMNRSGNNGSRPDMKALSRRSNYVEKPRDPSPYPQFKCFSAFLLEFKHRLAGFLRAQSVFFLFKGLGSMNAMFAFDGEFSVVALDFDLLKRKDEMDANSMKLKREIEYVGRIKFSPKRLVSILDGGGIAVRFGCVYAVPILQPMLHDNKTSITTITKNMRCELEIANVPDRSHRFIPGQRTIIRFRLLG
ncbi:hypothetical protein BDZ97DRAFT_1773564 [Flammula alnicola]|nr:hypothetical protein BDZ97DRAFT_1773564 [Flammula alnicola]